MTWNALNVVGIAVNAFFVGYRTATGEVGWIVFACVGVLMAILGLLVPAPARAETTTK